MTGVRFNFSGRRVLVTGASRGIGYAIADAFCAAAAEVHVLADTDEIHDAARRLEHSHSLEVHPILCDITDPSAVESAMSGLTGIDVLVNNAGLELITPLASHDPQTIQAFARIIDVNVMGTYHVTRQVLPAMKQGASIVQTCSIWSHTAVADFSAYCSSKHANLGFVRSLAAELAPRNIRVNGVCPGWVRTDAALRSLRHMSEKSGVAEQVLLDEILDAQLLPGLLEPADVTSTYLFLASDAAANITGQTITVNRGTR